MTYAFHPPQRDRDARREPFDPIIEGARYGLSRELSLAIWQRVCADATDATGQHDDDLARRRFHDLAAHLAARGGRLCPDPGRVTRAGVELASAPSATDELAVLAPGRDTLVSADARRWAQLGGETAPDAAAAQQHGHREPEPTEPPVLARGERAVGSAAARLFGRGSAGARSPGHGVAFLFGRASSNAQPTDVLYRRATEDGQVREDDPAIAEALARARAGDELPAPLKHEMEQALGVSLARVRVHVDDIAANATRAVAARAFTVGEDIFFARGAFAPGTAEGDKLLAHELAHVVQAYEGRTRTAAGALEVSRPGDALEREADAVADRVAARRPHAPPRRSALRSYAPVRSRSLLRTAAPDGVAMLDGVIDHLIEFWERQKQLDPSRATEFTGNIERLRARERPSARQSEQEMTEIHSWVGGQGERGYKHGRAAPRGGSGSKGATKPDVNLSTVMIEVKNYDINSKPMVRNLLKELERQIGERREMGPYNVMHQSVIIDVRGQRTKPGQLAALRKQIAQRTGLAEEHVQFAQWSTDSAPAVPNGKAAASTEPGASAKPTVATSASSEPKPPAGTSGSSERKPAGMSAAGESGSSATASGSTTSGTSAKTAPVGEPRPATPAASAKAAARRTPAVEPVAPPRSAQPAVTPPGGGKVSRLLGRFGEILTVVFSAKVQVPLGIATEILGVLDAMNMATGGLSGEGFVMQAEIAHAEQVERASQALLAWYRMQHDELLAAVTEANALILAKGSREAREAMREHAGALIQSVRGRGGDVSQLAGFAAAGREEANHKIQLATALLDSRELAILAASAGMGSAAQAKLVGAREDLYRIRGRLAATCDTLTKVQALLDEDAEILGFYR